jgi:glyoxylase-like metal-dependent hydrolase (beta-lactamase superfamily II)/ferredoxin
MADKKKIAPGNVDGDFFVDTSCISCGNCRDLAPANFAKSGKFYVINKQPENDLELDEVLGALICCPLGSIGTVATETANGTSAKQGIAQALLRFPEHIEDDVYYLGFNSPDSFGGKSYFIKNQDGNWMVDSPKFSSRLVKYIESQGGLSHIFLTHRDDVAEAEAYARHFKATRIIHRADLEAQKDAEIVFDGIESFSPHAQFTIIPTPGHTMGHSMLLYRQKFLFSGDVFTSRTYSNENIEAWPPHYCWNDWDEQTRSIERLISYPFEFMLPSHGRRFKGTVEETKRALEQCLKHCIEESNPDPVSLERADSFDEIAVWAKQTGQLEYAKYAADKASSIRQKLNLPASE